MIFLYHARLVILSQPKTGTTALDSALAPRASIVVNNPPPLKHMRYGTFMQFVAPWIKAQAGLDRSDYDVVSVMREPVDWIGSWYRYRTRDALKDAVNKKKRRSYSGNVSFDEFVREALKPKAERESFANLGSPCSVAMTDDGGVGCDRIFPYEDLSGFYELVAERSKKPVELSQMNVSPAGDTSLTAETKAKLMAQWAFAFDLHSSLNRDGAVDPRFRVASGGGEAEDDDVVVE